MAIIEARLLELGIELPTDAINKNALFVPSVIVNNILYTSGAVAGVGDNNHKYTGKVGSDLTLDEAKVAARKCAINLITFIKYSVGDLDRVKRIVNIIGYVNSAPGFNRQPEVLNSVSELFLQVWGENGKHARTALSVNELGSNACIECNAVVEVKDK